MDKQNESRREGDNDNNVNNRRDILCDQNNITKRKDNTKHSMRAFINKDNNKYEYNINKE